MFEPNVELIGTPSRISEGEAILLSTKLHRISIPLTVEPFGVNVELPFRLTVVDGPNE